MIDRRNGIKLDKRHHSNCNGCLGISLVEIMVALTIISVMSATVILSLTTIERTEKNVAENLLIHLMQARQHALISGIPIGFAADSDRQGYRFFIFQDGVWETDRVYTAFSNVRFSDDIQFFLDKGSFQKRPEVDIFRATTEEDEDEEKPVPEIWFDGSGFDPPFSYVLKSSSGKTVEITRGDDGQMIVSKE